MTILKELSNLNEAVSPGGYVWLAYVDEEGVSAIDLQDLDTLQVFTSEAAAVQYILDQMQMQIDENPKLETAAAKVKTARALDSLVAKFEDELDVFQDAYVITKVQIK